MRKFKPPLPDFSDPKVWQEFKRQCYDGTIEYEDFPADEYKYFDRLRITYLCYQYNHLPKDEAEQTEKQNVSCVRNTRGQRKRTDRPSGSTANTRKIYEGPSCCTLSSKKAKLLGISLKLRLRSSACLSEMLI